MADRARMSSRTFARRFQDQTGTTPAKCLAFERVKLAQRLLETTSLGIDQIERFSHDADLFRIGIGRLHSG
jgi:AraC family transcriptional regulator, transcriptional activator FtrA